ncbi:glycosyltransferase family 2 protein [Christensenella tenuis]|uniref:Glycosyltransferase family 2 protein n=1 Tax=Christensenella tenuis TaxID=2763033 RepID=A0ABR7EE87_9FIRM|nr:glycosyltransferase family 2 protein [Christensenella tenuis]MBC5648100.1 glycosyltransferase family 2 protein [Christensenella tenuis]
MSKLSNLRSVTKRLSKQKWNRAFAIIRDYGLGYFFYKVREKMTYGNAAAMQSKDVIINESFVKDPGHAKGFCAEQTVTFMTQPRFQNFWRIDVLTQNPHGNASLALTVTKADGTVLLETKTDRVAHNGYTSFRFLPVVNVLQVPCYFKFTSDMQSSGVLVNRKKSKHGFTVEGGGCVGCRIYMNHDAVYLHWMKNNDPTGAELAKQRAHVFPYMPKISILVPLYNTPEIFLRQMLDSVTAQTYSNWELCLADGSTTAQNLGEIAASYEDSRIVYRKLEKNEGISGNSNEAIKMATGEYIALLDHDDTLAPHALYSNVLMLNKNRDYDFIYSDEDKLTEDGEERFAPFFKPDFSPDMFNAFNYITHFVVIKKSLLDQVGSFRAEFNGAQDYDLFLRLTEKAKKIGHIPDILYHWRVSAGSTALDSGAKSYTVEAGRRALEASFKRKGLTTAHVKDSQLDNYYITSYDLPTPHPLVSIIIPNKDERKTLQRCIDSILSQSTYDRYEIIVVENNSTRKEIFAYYKKLQEDPRIRVIEWNHPFNYSALNNFAAQEARGELLLFLNNDVSVISPDWLEQMAMHAMRPEIGQVGAKLYYPSDLIQHGGIILKIGPVAGHSHRHLSRYDVGSFARMIIPHNVSGVTAACAMMRAEVFHEVGGFDEQFVVAYNDVDLSLKIREKGYLIVWTPFAELYHYESQTRGYEDTPEQIERSRKEQKKWLAKWDEKYPYDPFYNPNLANNAEDYSVNPGKRKYGI